MEEIEQIKGQMDVLIARSWAQEALLLFLARRSGAEEFGFVLDAESYMQQIHEHLRHSTLSDQQLQRYLQESRALLERLHRIAEKEQPLPPA